MASSNSARRPPNYLPPDVDYVLNWNPRKLKVTEYRDPKSLIQTTTAPSSSRLHKTTRPPSFYDKHLRKDLVLEHVVYLESLVESIAGIVDHTLDRLFDKGIELPTNLGTLIHMDTIKNRTRRSEISKEREAGVLQNYSEHAATYCLPIASTLALHPSFVEWDSLFVWSQELPNAKWAIADGALRFNKEIDNEDNEDWKAVLDSVDPTKRPFVEQLLKRRRLIALWEMKGLTVGDAIVMKEIEKMGRGLAAFRWKKCKPKYCRHDEKALKQMGVSLMHAPGVDATAPPWTLPVSGPSDPLRRRSHRISEQEKPDYAEASQNSVAGAGEDEQPETGSKRKRADSGKGPSPMKKDVPQASYTPSKPGQRREVNAQAFLQQSWAQAVRYDTTVIVLHSGNHEIIGIRHRKRQTIYVSQVIEPHNANPGRAYGRIQVGLYIAALQDAMDRMEQDIAMEELQKRNAGSHNKKEDGDEDNDGDGDGDGGGGGRSGDGKGGGGGGSRDGDGDGDGGRVYKRPRNNDTSENRKGGKGDTATTGKGKGRAVELTAKDQAIPDTTCRNVLFLHFYYGIYASPRPATFVRITPKDHHTTPRSSPGSRDKPQSVISMDIILKSELRPGSTGIVHIGTLQLDPSSPTFPVAVKLAFSGIEKETLEQEHELYTHLISKGVQGIPHNFGLFVDDEVDDTEGPYALVMAFAGLSLFGREELMTPSVKASLVDTLKFIHKAGVLHGDIRLPNLCASETEEAYIIDFSHSTRSSSREAKSRELKELCAILGIKDTKAKAKATRTANVMVEATAKTEVKAEATVKAKVKANAKAKEMPATNDGTDETGLRRSLRIKGAKEKTQRVEEDHVKEHRHRN